MNIQQAEQLVGKLGKPSKMPGYSYGLPAGYSCAVGSKLIPIKDSVCNKCYALRGNYLFPNVKKIQNKRLEAINDINWVDYMVALLDNYVSPDMPYFRWHDSGDIVSLDHLLKISEVAKRTKWVKHWLPTREYKIVKEYFKYVGGLHPKNLVIRVSAPMINGGVGEFPLTSQVTSDKNNVNCLAYKNDNKCGTCRKCWDISVKNVIYLKH